MRSLILPKACALLDPRIISFSLLLCPLFPKHTPKPTTYAQAFLKTAEYTFILKLLWLSMCGTDSQVKYLVLFKQMLPNAPLVQQRCVMHLSIPSQEWDSWAFPLNPAPTKKSTLTQVSPLSFICLPVYLPVWLSVCLSVSLKAGTCVPLGDLKLIMKQRTTPHF